MISITPQAGQGIVLASIDAGGTTFKCALIRVEPASAQVIARVRIPTTTPDETLAACAQFFQEQASTHGLQASAMGIASFGPIDIDPSSASCGMIMDGPKSSWPGTNLKTYFEQALSISGAIPVAINSDVNGALLAEMAWGAAQGCDTAAYMTIGTGIGAGLFVNGGLVGRPSHPEFGHIQVKRHDKDKVFSDVCTFHGDCLEGLASATALTRRFGDPRELEQDHVAWEIEAFYLAQACLSLSLAIRPQRIVLGGGIMLAPHLIGQVRREYAALLNGYLAQSKSDIAQLIVTPGLGDDAGIFGGARLAQIMRR